MKKIPTLFKRDFTKPGNPIIPEYNDEVGWVLDGQGTPTRKYDGMCALVRDRKLYKRHEVKPGKVAPPDFERVAFDEETGKAYGWVQVGWGSEDKYFREAIEHHGANPDMVLLVDGTYELLGPKVQSNPEHSPGHYLQPHWLAETFSDVPTDFDALQQWLIDKDIEGIVWHHSDGRMVKIKKKDFGLKRFRVNMTNTNNKNKQRKPFEGYGSLSRFIEWTIPEEYRTNLFAAINDEREIQNQQLEAKALVGDTITICTTCQCMTKTVGRFASCGKCGAQKYYTQAEVEAKVAEARVTDKLQNILDLNTTGNEVAIGYDDSGCFWRFCWGNRGAGSMIVGDKFNSESSELSEALDEWLTHLALTNKSKRKSKTNEL